MANKMKTQNNEAYTIQPEGKYSSFTNWFTFDPDTEVWTMTCGGTTVCTFSETEEIPPVAKAEFDRFKKFRPEYVVGKKCESAKSEQVAAYNDLIAGALMIRARNKGMYPDNALNRINSIINWLFSTDFYNAPASTRYHESYAGGLLEHTIKVYNNMIELRKLPKFKSVTADSCVVVALMHDWCKIDMYESYTKNVKNDKTGQWEQQVAYRKNQRGVPLGHGAASMFLASRVVALSIDEALAIRWHMGAWRCVQDEVDELQSANEKVPLVHLIQFADQLSIVEY